MRLATASCIETSTTWPGRPLPLDDRGHDPAAMCTPAPLSPMLAPQSTGSRSRSRHAHHPAIAWAIMSKLLYS